jgi:hypothetical protein
MKILRVRRGYTTNSSAYTEWLPPPPQGGNAGQTVTPPAQTPSPRAAGPAATVPGQTGQGVAAQAPSHLAGNSLLVAGLLAALVGVFVAERILRRLRRRGTKDIDADE